MTDCKAKCWCRQYSTKKSDPDDPMVLQGFSAIEHKIAHLYDGVEKCFKQIYALEDKFEYAEWYEALRPLIERIDEIESSMNALK